MRSNGRKQFSTKVTPNHSERMLEFMWKFEKPDEELINEFYSKIQVEKRSSTIDILPECLIHKILCFLSFKEATRMSILSKTWLQTCSNLPNLDFTVDYSKIKDIIIMDDIMNRYRDGKIPIEKFELLEKEHYGFLRDRLAYPLIDQWLDIALTNGVKDLKLYLTLYRLPILSILAVNSLRELVMNSCTLSPVLLSSVVVNCTSLRKLSLSYASLDENMLQTLLNSCPLIESFIFEFCVGLKTIYQVVNLQKIKSVSLKVLKIRYCGGLWEIDAPNLVSFEYEWHQIPQLKIESRQLKHSKITLRCYDHLDAGWFCKLRKFLSSSPTWSHVSIDFSAFNKINLNDLPMDHKGSTRQLDDLNVYCNTRLGRKYPTFVKALLWSCDPRRLNLQSTRETLKFFVSHLMYEYEEIEKQTLV